MKEGNILAFGACGINLLRLDTFLGKGTFGSSWAVTDLDTGRRYCLKLIRAAGADDPAHLAELAVRVRNEAGVQIPSEYVTRAVGFQVYSEREFGVLFELFERARPLSVWMREEGRSAPWSRKRHLLCQALKGIAAAHACNIVHRDIKPGNILVNDLDQVRVMDFGIGKFKQGTGEGPTQPGSRMGTLAYMAPELGVDASRADSRCDVYAFGHLVYEMIAGRNVWQERGWLGQQGLGLIAFLEYARSHTHLIDVHRFVFDEEPYVQTVLQHALSFEVADRYPSGEVMLADWFGLEATRDVLVGAAAQAGAVGHAARFRILQGGQPGALIPLALQEGESAVLGRQQVDSKNKYLSRRHVQVRRAGGRFYLSDAGSTNGTVYGGRLLGQHEQVELHDGDRVRLAETFLAFELA